MPDDTDDALDENGLLRPGRTRRVSFMDSLKAFAVSSSQTKSGKT